MAMRESTNLPIYELRSSVSRHGVILGRLAQWVPLDPGIWEDRWCSA
jgi:hypothetical protein